MRLILLLVLCAMTSTVRGVDPPYPYLIAGEFEYLGGMDDPDLPVGTKTQFTVGFTEHRGVVGWSTQEPKARFTEQYHYVDEETKQVIAVAYEVESFESMLTTKKDRPAALAIRDPQRKQVATFEERLSELELAVFSNIRFAVFFGSSYHGVPATTVMQSISSSNRVNETSHACGKLTTTKDAEGRLESIQFVQRSDDLLTVRVQDQQVKNSRSHLLNENYSEIVYACNFLSPLRFPLESWPWASTCSVQFRGKSGKTRLAKYRVTVLTCLTDTSKINSEMDKILRSIPEGEEVQAPSNVEYVWSKGAVIKRIDYDGLGIADRLSFTGKNSARLR